jgi:hypothetical protein
MDTLMNLFTKEIRLTDAAFTGVCEPDERSIGIEVTV